MKKPVLIFLMVLFGIYGGGCGPAAPLFNIVPNEENIEVRFNEHSLPDGKTINESEFILPLVAGGDTIEEVDYDDSIGALLVKYAVGEDRKSVV